MIKRFRMCLYLLTIIFIMGFPVTTQAKPIYVLECAEDDTECQENISNINKAETENHQSIETKKDESLFLSIVQTFFALLLVLALIYILLKVLNKRNKSFAQVKSLENIGGIPIGQNKSIQLVRVGTKIYMIGVGDNVELLEEITDDQLKEELLHTEEENEFQVSNLFSSLPSFKSNKKAKITSNNNEFKNLFTNELTKLKQTRTKIKDQNSQKEDTDE